MPVTSGAQSTEGNFGNTPSAPSGKRLVTWQAGSPYNDQNNPGYQIRDISAYIDAGAALHLVIDGGGSVPTTGFKGYAQAPFDGTITAWSIAADAAGTAQITVKKCADGSFPTTASIVASAPPILGVASPLSNAQKAESTSLTGWTTAFSQGDWFEFHLDSVTTCKWLTLKLQITKA